MRNRGTLLCRGRSFVLFELEMPPTQDLQCQRHNTSEPRTSSSPDGETSKPSLSICSNGNQPWRGFILLRLITGTYQPYKRKDKSLCQSCVARVKLLALSNWCEVECMRGYIQLQISSLVSDGFIRSPLGEEQTRSQSSSFLPRSRLCWACF